MKRDKLGRFVEGVKYWKLRKKQLYGKEHHMWNGGKKETNGYMCIYLPEHPRACRKYVYEHIVVAEQKVGRYLKKTERVHHINGIKTDNRPENLIVFKNDSEHLKEHRMKTWSKIYDKCVQCGTTARKHNAYGLCLYCYNIRIGIRK